jgi:hypothetical protein
MGSLVQQREELERKVDDLRAFEREYRSRLKVYLEGQLRDLEVGATEGGAFSGGTPPAGTQTPRHHAEPEGRNGQQNVVPGAGAPGNTGPHPFPPPAEAAQHAQHSGTGAFHAAADSPPHDRR